MIILDWFKRAKKDQTSTSVRRTWETRCRRYRVEHHVPTLSGLTPRFLAISERDGVISRHRVKSRAVAACEIHASKGSRRRAG